MALGWLCWRAWVPFDAVVTAAVCVASMALGDIHLHFAWHAWHLVTSTFTLRGRCGIYGTGLALVARLGPAQIEMKNTKSKRGAWKSNRLEVLHLFRWFTHTYTHTDIYTSNSLTRKSFIRTFHHLMSLACLSHSVFTLLL